MMQRWASIRKEAQKIPVGRDLVQELIQERREAAKSEWVRRGQSGKKLGLPAAQRIRLTEGVSLSDLLLEDRLELGFIGFIGFKDGQD